MGRGSQKEEPAPDDESLAASFKQHKERVRAFRGSLTPGSQQSASHSRKTEAATPPVTVAEGGSSEMEKHPLILAVDDEAPILELLRVNLTAEGYNVITASDGMVALKLLEEHIPDLLLLDIMMPNLDGMQVLERIRRTSDIPVIMVTARCEVAALRDSLNLGADDFVRKPFSVLELTARVKAKLRLAERGKKATEVVGAHAAALVQSARPEEGIPVSSGEPAIGSSNFQQPSHAANFGSRLAGK